MNTPPPLILVYMTVKSCATQWQTARYYFQVVGYACVCNKDARYTRTVFSFFKGYRYFIISSWVSQRNKTRHTWQIRSRLVRSSCCFVYVTGMSGYVRDVSQVIYVCNENVLFDTHDLPNQMVLQLNAIRVMYLLSRYNVHVSKSA